ncbi:MAG: CBS domain-containing protein [Streptosporangiaceae bacterium]|jgi:CBS domain-containing protein
MARSDIHRDAMLRHLGVTYYESLHGSATAADVSRAVNSVEDHAWQHSGDRPAAAASSTAAAHGRCEGKQHHGRWHSRIGDVMTTNVVTVERRTPYKEIAAVMAQHGISGVPVLVLGRHVAGLVSEADLLSVQDQRAREAQLDSGSHHLHWHAGDKKHWGLTAGELMTSPAITIHPDATLPAAARLMNSRHLKRLPVVEPGTVFGGGVGGRLIGIVSRCDLLSVFLRPDEDIAREVREMLSQILLADPASVTVRVRGGVVTLAGQLGSAEQHDLIKVAARLTWDIDGVVDVVNKLSAVESSTQSVQAPGLRYSGAPATPADMVASAYDFAGQLLASQRKFAQNVIEATMPVLGGRQGPAPPEGPAAGEGQEDPARAEGPVAGQGGAS